MCLSAGSQWRTFLLLSCLPQHLHLYSKGFSPGIMYWFENFLMPFGHCEIFKLSWVDGELHPLRVKNPPSLRPHLARAPVTSTNGRCGEESRNEVAVLFESEAAAGLMTGATNLAFAWASRTCRLAKAGRAEANHLSFLNKTEGPWLPSRQGETLRGPGLNGKAFYAV